MIFSQQTIFLLVLTCAVFPVSHGASTSRHEQREPRDHTTPIWWSSNTETDSDLATARIVGGEDAEEGEYPFYIQWYGNGEGTCGGSLIHEDIMLTAAHCQLNSNNVWVGGYEDRVSNDHGTETRTITKRRRHPQYNGNTLEFDYEVMLLNSPVTTITPIMLNADTNSPSDGEMLTVVGLGDTSESGNDADILQKVDVPKVNDNTCNNQYQNEGGINKDVMLCAGEAGKDSCQQDSGGPIFNMVNGEPVQVGIVSWGIGCARANFPGVYSRVSNQVDWIKTQICDLSNNPPASCDGGGGGGPNDLEITLLTDNYGGETSFFVKNLDTNERLLNEKFETLEDNTEYTYSLTLDPDACYRIKIRDDFGDGICCNEGNGQFTATLDGVVVASFAEFGSKKSKKVGGGC